MKVLPPLRSIVDQFGLLPDKKHSKRYGQNFIFDEQITRKIVQFARLPKGALALEIGPGPGGLTRAILEKDVRHVVAIEYDPLCVKALKYLTTAFNHLTVLYDDALKVSLVDVLQTMQDKGAACSTDKVHIIANLPYNIGTELLLRWLLNLESISSMTLMFQKEVALRINAPLHTKDYGRLSIIAQLLCDVEMGFDLPPTIFTPAPKVESSVIHLTPKANFKDTLPYIDTLSKITNVAFQQRRKHIKTPLSTLFGNMLDDALSFAHVDPTLRAENLTPAHYLALALFYTKNVATFKG